MHRTPERVERLPRCVQDSSAWPAEAAQRFYVTRPRISDSQRGKIDLFSVDRLINMLAQAGMHVEVGVKTAA